MLKVLIIRYSINGSNTNKAKEIKMKTLTILLALSIGFALASCSSKTELNEHGEHDLQHDAAHNSRNSLDWSGAYRGTVPCADCEGIQTEVRLMDDMTYEIATKYLGKSDEIFRTSGKFEWNDEGSEITLIDPDNERDNSYYKVGENRLIRLARDGGEIEGELADMYILTKPAADQDITEKYWKLIELMGEPVPDDVIEDREPHIILKKPDTRVIGSTGCNRIMGGYELLEENRIKFSQIVTTRMACPNIEYEQKFLDAFVMVDNYTNSGDTLELNNVDLVPIARFVNVYLR